MGLAAAVLNRAVLRPHCHSVTEQQQNSHLLTLWPVFSPLHEAEARKSSVLVSLLSGALQNSGLSHELNCNKYL